MVLRCASVNGEPMPTVWAAPMDGVSPFHMGILTDIGQSV